MADTATQIKTKEKTGKKSRGKTALKVICIILAVILGLSGITAAANVITRNALRKTADSYKAVEYDKQLVPVKDSDGSWVFTTDNDFKILQFTDIHLGGGFMSTDEDASAMQAVATMITCEKPDLVVVTGDISFPVPFIAGTFNNKSAAVIFADLMESLGVYWTLAYGNHDTEAYSYYSREELTKAYMNEEYKHCILTPGPAEVDGVGNQLIKVKNSAGVTTQGLIMLDSHSYTDEDPLGIKWIYDNIHENQIEWYKTQIENINIANAKLGVTDTVKSLCFFHIPLMEYKTAWAEFTDNGFTDTEDAKFIYGMAGETDKIVYSSDIENNLFDTMLELGSTKGVFCGHDHFNNFSLEYKGIRLTYGRSIDYLAYSGIDHQGSQRGCTQITVFPDGSFNCAPKDYYSDEYTLEGYTKEDVTMQFEDVTYQYYKPAETK